MKFQIHHSLKWKIQFWYALILAVVLVSLGTSFYFYVKQERLKDLDQWLDQQIPPIIGAPSDRRSPPNKEAGPPPERLGAQTKGTGPGADLDRNTVELRRNSKLIPEGWELEESGLPEIVGKDFELPRGPRNYREKFEEYYVPLGFYAIVMDTVSEEVEFRTANAPNIEIPMVQFPGYFSRLREGRYREIYHPNPIKRVLIGVDVASFQSSLRELKIRISGVVFFIFFLSVAVGYLMVSRFLRPLDRIQKSATDIAGGALDVRIPTGSIDDSDELGQLSKKLNATFAQLEALFERQIRFTADASHELRTPLTALLAQIEYAQTSQRSEEEIVQILTVCARSGERIRFITEQLIELSHYDANRVRLEYEAIPLDAFLQSLVEEMEHYVQKNGSHIETDLQGDVFECDPFRLHQVISNLVNNALQHNDASIQITLRSRIEGEAVHIEISDNGKGIQPENVEKLFDRFFQESTSRAKENNRMNVGLGLSISQAIVLAHGGRLSASSEPGIRTTFSVRMPRFRQVE